MVTFFDAAGIFFWLIGLPSCGLSRGAVHDANGALLILTGTVFIVGAAILRELQRLRQKPKAQP